MVLSLINLEKEMGLSSLSRISDPLLDQHQIELWLKRDDLLHPVISGNKWRKLKYNLHHALQDEKDTIISMGGAYSNHLHALAYVGNALNLNTVGYIRGEQLPQLNATLQDLQSWRMQLNFISRSYYRKLRHFQQLPQQRPNEYWLPEGGAVSYALKGITEMMDEINSRFDCICVPCGTGTTMAGMIASAPDQATVLGFAALKGEHFLERDVADLLPDAKQLRCHWALNHDYHFGGFAKTSPELLEFIKYFEQQTGIAIEPVYTGKMLFGIYALIRQGYFTSGQRIIALHTGGLQGNRGFNDG